SVAVDDNQEKPLILRSRTEADFLARKFLLQKFVISFVGFVFPIKSLALIVVSGDDQIIGHFREVRASEVDALHRIRFDQLFFTGGGIKKFKASEIDIGTFVGFKIDSLAVFVVTHRPTAFEHVAGINFGKAAVVDAQDFGVAIVCRAGRQAQLIFEIKHPAGDALGILADQGAFAGGDFYFVEVVPGLVAIV